MPLRRVQRRPRHRKQALVPMTVCRLRRQELGMSQKRLAELAKVPQPYVSRAELQQSVHPEDLKAIAEVLGLNPDVLIDEVQGGQS